MADEEVVGAASPPPSDHKRKLEDLELDSYEPPNGNSESADAPINGVASEDSDSKRPRLDDKPDGLDASENGHQEEKADEPKEEVSEQSILEKNTETELSQEQVDGSPEAVNNDPSNNNNDTGAIEQPSDENPATANAGESTKEEHPEPHEELQDTPQDVSQLGVVSVDEQKSTSTDQLISRKMEVPSNKVGVLIGKAGDTIRTLQYNSGARIQITRDADADPNSTTRPVELIGSLENINKAEKLIKDVIAEADAGGSPSLVARGFSTVKSSGAGEQIQIQVPNEKVGLIIGKGGETIKSLQTRSGARIQLIPQHLPEGDQSKERTVRVTGDRKQIEVAREMIKEAMNQPIRSSTPSSGYNQQGHRPRGPGPQWGPRGQPSGYDYPQRGTSYPSHQNPQYPFSAYGNYPPQQQLPPPRSNFGWDQKPPTNMQQGPPEHTDYYGGSHTATPSNPMGPPPSQTNYNYGQPQGPADYGQQPNPYPQTAPPHSYGHGYNETKGPLTYPQGTTHPYGSQPSTYPQGTTHPGFGQQEQYGKPPAAYNMPQQQGPHSQPYQGGPVSSAPAQQPYGPYASSGPMAQAYPPPYGSAPANDGYSHTAPPAQGYPQQGGQPVSGYAQTVGQQQQAPSGYAQVGSTGGYGQYLSAQPGYTEQAVGANNAAAGYGGYQGAADPAAYGAAPGSGYGAPQPVYSQPAPTQAGYDQSVVPQSGGYGNATVGYGKSASPQPQPQASYSQYDASQMYGGHR